LAKNPFNVKIENDLYHFFNLIPKMKNAKLYLVALVLALAPLFPITSNAILVDGSNAVDMLGFYDDNLENPSPAWDKVDPNVRNGGTNRLGISISTSQAALDSVNNRYFLLDNGNNRVLVYNLNPDNTFPDKIPDNVIGQPNFYTNTSAVTQSGLNSPSGLAYDAINNRLFVSAGYGMAGGASRVMVYDVSTIENGQDAIAVLGQANFTSTDSAVTISGLHGPRGLAYDAVNERLFVAQQQGHRVSIFDVSEITNGEPAVNVLGQVDFTSSTGATTAAGLSNPLGLAYDSGKGLLFVSQHGFGGASGPAANRVSVFDVNVIANGEAAANVLGQTLFTTGTGAVTQAGMSGPRGIAHDPVRDYLFVSNSSRVTVYDVAAITNGENAIAVLGQADFTSSTGGSTQTGLYGPSGLVYDTENDHLLVLDDSNNRVMIFDVATIDNGEPAVDLIGQYGDDLLNPEPVYTKSGANNAPGKLGFNIDPYYSSVVLDDVNHRFFVTDTQNHRVLVYDLNEDSTFPDRIPDYVLGQPNFYSNTAALTQEGMTYPRGLAYDSDNNRLFVSESTGANRVKVYDVAEITNGEAAINVLGQADFVSGVDAVTQDGMHSPMGLAYDATNQRLFVAQDEASRVTVYDVAAITNGEAAINVLGQADFETVDNTTAINRMRAPKGLAYDAESDLLFVTQASKHRVTVYDVAEITNGEDAIAVLGQPDFTSADALTTQDGMYAPEGIAYDPDNKRLFVAQTGFGGIRITAYNVAEITNGEAAINVLGQADYVSGDDSSTQSGLRYPTGLAYDATNNRLYVNDSGNHRVVAFDVAVANSPTEVAAQANGPNAAKLTWDANENLEETEYQVYNTSTSEVVATTTNTSAVVAGLTPSTEYTFTVRAISLADGESYVESEEVSVTTAALSTSITMTLAIGESAGFSFAGVGEAHTVAIDDIDDSTPEAPIAEMTITSEPVTVNLGVGSSETIDTNGDGHSETTVLINSVDTGSNEVNFTLSYVPMPSSGGSGLLSLPQTQTSTSSQTSQESATGETTASPSESESGFSDMGGHWADEYVVKLQGTGVVEGYQDGSFKPDDFVTRAELLKMVVEAFDIEEADSSDYPFTDIDSSDWFNYYVTTAYMKGFINGYPDLTFRPYAEMNRAEALAMILKASELNIVTQDLVTMFPDTLSTDWYFDYIMFAAEHEIVHGYEDGNFGPHDRITRGQAAKMIVVVMDILGR
jgi:DNA-binding beta-propeller fold protein YncE